MNFIKQFLSVKYLFQINRVMIEPGDYYFFIAGLILVIIALIFKVSQVYAPDPVNKKYRGKFFNLFAWIGALELVWYGARFYYIKFFGTHFVAWLIVAIGFIWLVCLVFKIAKNYRKEKEIWDKEQVKAKYLPK